jgi:transcriptional regulator with PAS, ATPase and Fis domain
MRKHRLAQPPVPPPGDGRVGAARVNGLDRRLEVGGKVSLKSLEAEHIRRVLENSPSLDEAAQVLGINPSTLYRKRKRLGL